MKKTITFFFLSMTLCFSAFSSEEAEHKHENSHSHGHHDHEEDSHHEEVLDNSGPGKAVIKASKEKGFQLSDTAFRTLGLQTMKVQDPQRIPETSFVFYQDKVGVYRFHDGWFKQISPKRLEAGDVIVTSGTGLLRIVELDLFTKNVEGHSH